MSAVEVTIDGIIWDKALKAGRPVTIIGQAFLTGLGVGGGPMPPGNGQPPSIWPSPGRPAHPIAPGGPPPTVWPDPGYPAHPIAPGGRPPGIWGGPIDPSPGHPLPEPPGKPEEPLQPPIEWKAVWHPELGWVVVGIPNFEHPAPAE